MSRDASIRTPFGGEERTFRLDVGRWRAVQEKCDAGPQELLRRYVDGTWRLDDLREVLLQGLIGGGETQADATRLIKSYFDDLPMMQFLPIAQGAVMATLVGAPDEDDAPGELGAGAAAPETPSRAARSGSRRSTSAVARKATPRAK